jgi:hypothetical protein
MLIFAAATQGFFMARNRIWETVALLLVTFLLLRPGFFLDLVQPPYDAVEPQRIHETVGAQPDDAEVRVHIAGPSFNDPGRTLDRIMAFNLGPAGESGQARFESATGLAMRIEGDMAILDEPLDMNSLAGRTLSDMDFYADEPVTVTALEVTAERMPREVFYIPAILLLCLVIWSQRRRGGTLAGNPKAA